MMFTKTKHKVINILKSLISTLAKMLFRNHSLASVPKLRSRYEQELLGAQHHRGELRDPCTKSLALGGHKARTDRNECK